MNPLSTNTFRKGSSRNQCVWFVFWFLFWNRQSVSVVLLRPLMHEYMRKNLLLRCRTDRVRPRMRSVWTPVESHLKIHSISRSFNSMDQVSPDTTDQSDHTSTFRQTSQYLRWKWRPRTRHALHVEEFVSNASDAIAESLEIRSYPQRLARQLTKKLQATHTIQSEKYRLPTYLQHTWCVGQVRNQILQWTQFCVCSSSDANCQLKKHSDQRNWCLRLRHKCILWSYVRDYSTDDAERKHTSTVDALPSKSQCYRDCRLCRLRKRDRTSCSMTRRVRLTITIEN